MMFAATFSDIEKTFIINNKRKIKDGSNNHHRKL